MLTTQQLWQMEMDQLRLEQGREPDPDLWRWSPLDITVFEKMLAIAAQLAIDMSIPRGHAERQLSFVEAGCGIGTKLYLAKHRFDMIEVGYEINDEYLTSCHQLGVHAEKRDLADEYNPPIWAAFDIVYIARPFKDDLREAQWERSVHADMRPGSVLVSAFAAVKPYDWLCFYRRPFQGIWVKPEPGVYTDPVTAASTA